MVTDCVLLMGGGRPASMQSPARPGPHPMAANHCGARDCSKSIGRRSYSTHVRGSREHGARVQGVRLVGGPESGGSMNRKLVSFESSARFRRSTGYETVVASPKLKGTGFSPSVDLPHMVLVIRKRTQDCRPGLLPAVPDRYRYAIRARNCHDPITSR